MLGYCFSGPQENLISKAAIMETNGDSKQLLFYLIFNICYFISIFNITTLPCLTVGGELYVETAVFPPMFKMGRSKQNDIVKFWKFSIKMGGGFGGWWANSFFMLSIILRTLLYLII